MCTSMDAPDDYSSALIASADACDKGEQCGRNLLSEGRHPTNNSEFLAIKHTRR